MAVVHPKDDSLRMKEDSRLESFQSGCDFSQDFRRGSLRLGVGLLD